MPQIKHPGRTMSSGSALCHLALHSANRLCTLSSASVHCHPPLYTANRPCTLSSASVHCQPPLYTANRLCTLLTGSAQSAAHLSLSISKLKNPGTYPCRQFNGQGTCLFIPVVRALRILRVGAHCLHIFSFQMFHRNFLYR